MRPRTQKATEDVNSFVDPISEALRNPFVKRSHAEADARERGEAKLRNKKNTRLHLLGVAMKLLKLASMACPTEKLDGD
jgi:hypothetical protein